MPNSNSTLRTILSAAAVFLVTGCGGVHCPKDDADGSIRFIAADPGKGGEDVFAACLDAGANPNSTVATGEEPDGWTPLLLTAYGNFNDGSRQSNDSIWNASSMEQAKLLLEHGADLNAITPEGANALHLAAAAGRIELSRFLISKGIAIDAKSKAGTTPLFGAVVSGSKDLVGDLISKGADVNTVGSEGQTPLDLAIILDNDREQAAFRGARNSDPKGVLELLKANNAHPGTSASN